MTNKYCNNCHLVLNQDVKFCPQCGGVVVKYKQKREGSVFSRLGKKKLIIIGSIVVGVIVLGIVAFAIIQAVTLNNKATAAKNNINNKSVAEFQSDVIGNVPCNVSAGAYSVASGEKLYFALNDGIYVSNNLNIDVINKDESKKIADGKFTSLNLYRGNLFAINSADNSIYKLSDLDNEDKDPYVDNIYTCPPEYTLKCCAVNSDNVYVLSSGGGMFYLTSTNLRTKNKINDIFEGQGTNAWMYLSEYTIRLCVENSGSWAAYKGEIDGNKTSGINKYCSGSGSPISVAFDEDKVYVLCGSSSDKSTIVISDEAGNSRDISLDKNAKKLLLSGESAFVEYSGNSFAWFNTDTNMTHDIESDNFKDDKVRTINVNNGRFCVLYFDEQVVTFDINSLN